MRAMLTIVLVTVSGTVALGQDPATRGTVPFAGPSAYGIDYYPFGYGHSSTLQEGLGRGLGDMFRSIGRANLENSEAAVNLEEAQRRHIENFKLGTQAYFDMRESNRSRRAIEGKRYPLTPETLSRYARAGVPRQLSNRELDPATGAIHWPILLMLRQFDDERAVVEQVFVDRAYHGVIGAQSFLVVKQTTDNMLASLREEIHFYPAQEYMTARRFLESLSYEASRPAG
jgi:hypothetical protein